MHPSLQALDDRVSLVACVTSVLGGPMRVICNHHFSELVCTAKDFYQRMEAESISPFIIWAKYARPLTLLSPTPTDGLLTRVVFSR